MLTIDWPSTLRHARVQWTLRKAGMGFRSPMNGTYQAIDLNAERWIASVQLSDTRRDEGQAIDALLEVLAGGVNRLRLWNLASGSRTQPGAPRGTMRGAPTVQAAAARGLTQFNIQTTAGATVFQGDMVGVNGQVLRARQDSTANGSGVLTFYSTGFLRSDLTVGMAVTWDKPTALFVLPVQQLAGTHLPARGYMGALLDLEEVW